MQRRISLATRNQDPDSFPLSTAFLTYYGVPIKFIAFRMIPYCRVEPSALSKMNESVHAVALVYYCGVYSVVFI